jgi:hypothetical protein
MDYLVTTEAIGDPSLAAPLSATKLSDVQINAVIADSPSLEREYRFEVPQTANNVFLQSSANYSDTTSSFGLLTGTRSICISVDYISCGFVSTTMTGLDIWPVYTGDNCQRVFTDIDRVGGCYNKERVSEGRNNRCLSAGWDCTFAGNTHYPPIQGTKIFVRQAVV